MGSESYEKEWERVMRSSLRYVIGAVVQVERAWMTPEQI